MIPASFDYVAPTSLVEALEALREHGDGAKIIAGGQSLLGTHYDTGALIISLVGSLGMKVELIARSSVGNRRSPMRTS